MPGISIKRQELHDSFRKHYQLYKTTNGNKKSRRLILFYSVECALKCMALMDIQKSNTDDMFKSTKYGELSSRGHDIKLLIKKLGLSSKFEIKNVEARDNIIIEPARFNELWRYGLDANCDDEEEAEDTLKDIAQYIEEKIIFH